MTVTRPTPSFSSPPRLSPVQGSSRDPATGRAIPVEQADLGGRWLIDQLAVTTRRYPAGAYTVQGSSGYPMRNRRVAER